MNPPDSPRPADLAPLSPGKRVGMLTGLVLLPFALVCLPAVIVFQCSERQGTFASWGKSRGVPDVSGLRGSLEQSAQRGLPAPGPLDSAPVELHSSPERVAARVAKVSKLARDFGGSAAEGLPTGGPDKHLYVEVPAGRAATFRAAVKAGELPAALPAASAGNEQIEVIIHTGDE